MEHVEIRDTRNGSWYWVNTAVNACPHITPIDKTVYSALCTFAGYTEIRPSYEEISRRSSVSIRRCKESVKKLAKAGLISVIQKVGRGNANIYTLLKCPKGCVSCTFLNGAENDPEKVRFTTVKGADGAPHIYKDIDKKYITEETSEKFKRKPKDQNSILIVEERERKVGRKFPNKMKQAAAVRRMLDAQYTKEQIVEEYDWLEGQPYWKGKVDFTLVANQIHKEHD